MRRGTRGLGLLDVVVVIALLAVLVYCLRLDWQRRRPAPVAAAPPAAAVP